ncbi:MAG: hypothetical protein ACE5MI_01215 [Acidimicrobiia bacterium]
MLFRFAFLAVGLIALGALLFGGAEGVGAGLLLLAPLLILGKILIILLFIGAVGGFFFRSYDGRPRQPWNRHRPARRSQVPPTKSRQEQFEDWHRLAHARDEVDSWVGDLDWDRDNEQSENGSDR